MTKAEQKTLINELRDKEMKMTRAEQEMFDMFRKRDKDDEDLDAISRRKLVELHKKYVIPKQSSGNPLDALFGKSS
jgi:hypothetical protein